MNRSNFLHGLLSLLAQTAIAVGLCAGAGWRVPDGLFAAALFPVGFYLGREVAQHERKAGVPPWWSGFRFTDWSMDAKLDLIVPVTFCVVLWLVSEVCWR